MIKKEYSLKTENSFGIDVTADEYLSIVSEKHLIELIKSGSLVNKKYMVLGGGSNILFTGNYKGLILHPTMDNINLIEERGNNVILECGAGVEWDKLVEYCVENSIGGLENLSYIPGNVGAAPIQNIGAYGVEVKDSLLSVRTVNTLSGDVETYTNKQCNFAYRSSIFKFNLKGKVVISSVKFSLVRNPSSFNTSYGKVSDRIAEKGEITLQNLRDTIIEIRKEKLPEPDEIGNAGSFFKNPVINKDLLKYLIKKYTDIPTYPAEEGKVKIPAGWLIERCGWKGYRKGDAGVHTKQALVLVNYGNASGREMVELSEKIIESVNSKFNIPLEREVNIV